MANASYIFASSDTIDASKLNQNFSDLTLALTGLRSANLDSAAGILSTQLASRYSLNEESFFFVPLQDTGGTINIADGSAGTNPYTVAATAVDMIKRRLSLKSGEEGYICLIEVYVAYVVAGGSGGYPSLTVKKGSTTIGGASVTMNTVSTYWSLKNSNPMDSPLMAFSDGDEIVLNLGSSAADTPKIRGAWMRIVTKKEHVS